MKICLTNGELWTKIGISAEERASQQRILATVTIEGDFAAPDDSLVQTVDYSELWQRIHTLAKSERKTLEKLAEDIAEAARSFDHVQRVEITLTKRPFPGVEHVTLTLIRP